MKRRQLLAITTAKVKVDTNCKLKQCTEVNMNEVVIKILQGTVFTPAVFGGLTICQLYVFQLLLSCICAKHYRNW